MNLCTVILKELRSELRFSSYLPARVLKFEQVVHKFESDGSSRLIRAYLSSVAKRVILEIPFVVYGCFIEFVGSFAFCLELLIGVRIERV